MDRWPCWTYFNHILDAPVWDGVRILDFGGNWGNFLRDPQCAVRPEQYWCLDIDLHAVELGRRDFPTGHWHHYNRWNQRYNLRLQGWNRRALVRCLRPPRQT